MWPKLQKRLNKLNVKHIDYLILTHTHFDHVDNARRIREKYGAMVIVHKNEASCLSSGENYVPGGTNFFTRTIVSLVSRHRSPKLRSEPCEYDIVAEEILDLTDMGFNAYILHTPGHSSGSVSIIVDDEIALVGDTMFGIFPWSVFPPFADDVKQMTESWGKLLETNCRLFLPGHGTANKRSLVQKNILLRKGKS
jgi:glyoxylase-like metal-dependent hydrolase (beta-lactamase superfamily II)